MKLLEYLQKIRTGKMFGTVVAGTMPSAFSLLSSFFLPMFLIFHVFHLPCCFPVLYTIEFEKRGLPHARVLVWQKDDDRVVTPTFISSFVSTTVSISIRFTVLFIFFPLAWFPMISLTLSQGSELAGVAANAPATALTNTMEIGLAQPPRLKRYDLSRQ